MKPIEASVSVSELKSRKTILTEDKTLPIKRVNVIDVRMNGEWDGGTGKEEKFQISIHLTVPADGKPDQFFIGDELYISILDGCEHCIRNI
jgi:hypothetical protein